MKLAFPPPAAVERRTAFLAPADLEAARKLAGQGVDLDQRVVTYYVGTSEGAPLGVAYFDVSRVRTLPAVLLIVVTPEQKIGRIEVLKWSEPPDYRAPKPWLDQFTGKTLTDELTLKGAIRNMTGASLTSEAVTRAARRWLALNQVIRPFGPAPQATAGTS